MSDGLRTPLNKYQNYQIEYSISIEANGCRWQERTWNYVIKRFNEEYLKIKLQENKKHQNQKSKLSNSEKHKTKG